MPLPDNELFLLNTIFKGLRKKAYETCPFMGYAYAISLKMPSLCLTFHQNFSMIARREEYYSHIHNGHPSATWYN